MYYKIVKRPIISLVFYLGLFLLPLVFWPWAPVPYEIPKVWFFNRWVEVLVVLGVVGFLGGKKENKEKKGNVGLVLVVGGFVLASIISSLLGVDLQKSVWGNYFRGDGLITLFHLAGLFYFLVLFWNKDWEKPTSLAIAGGSLVVSGWTIILGVLGKLGIIGVIGGSRFEGAIGGTFGNPNFLAGYLLVSLPFTVFALRGRGKIRRIGVIGEIIAIILTGSRGAIIGVLLLGVGYLWGRLGKAGRLGVLGVLGVVGILGIMGLRKELKVSEGMYFYPESRGRIIIRGYKAFERKPIFGWGVANFDYAFEAINWPIKVEKDVYVDKAHSGLLEVLVTTGVVGLLIYLAIIIGVIRGIGEIRENNAWKQTLLPAFLIFLFSSQTNVISINEEMIFWLIAGITAASG